MGKIIYLKMKFLTLTALVAVAQASVGADCGADVEADAVTGSKCDETECCGVAKPSEGSSAEEDKTICQTDSLTAYVDPDDDALEYDFSCAVMAEGAIKLAVSSLALAYMLA